MATPFNSPPIPVLKELKNVQSITFSDNTQMTSTNSFASKTAHQYGENQETNVNYSYTISQGQPSDNLLQFGSTPQDYGNEFGGSLYDSLLATITNNTSSSRKVLIQANIYGESDDSAFYIGGAFWRGNANDGNGIILKADAKTGAGNNYRIINQFSEADYQSYQYSTLMHVNLCYIDILPANSTVSYCPVIINNRSFDSTFTLNRTVDNLDDHDHEIAISNIWAMFIN